MQRILRFSLIAITALGVTPASAETAAEEGSGWGFYLEGQGNGTYAEVPEVKNFFGIGPSAATATDIGSDDDAWGGGFGMRAGLVLPEERSPIGENFRIEIGGNFLDADNSRQSTSFVASDAGILIAVDGSASIAAPFGSDGSTETWFDYDSWRADLLVRTDFGDEGSIRVSPFGGFTYQEVDRSENFRLTFDADFPPITTNDDIDLQYVGGVIGTTVTIPLGDTFVLGIEGRADLLNYDADLEVDQSSTLGILAAKDDDSGFAARLGGTASASMPVGPFRFALEGFASWLSWAGQVEHPALTTGIPSGMSQLTDAETWQWGGGLRISILFQ